jgi:hypothetical protein
MKVVTPNLFRCQFFEFLQFSETRKLGDRVFYWAVFKLRSLCTYTAYITNDNNLILRHHSNLRGFLEYVLKTARSEVPTCFAKT